MLTLELADWRRRVNSLYAEIRAEPNPRVAWSRWKQTRDDLFCSHSQSPISAERRPAYTGIPVWPYDETLRFEVDLVEENSDESASDSANGYDAAGGKDGVISLRKVGVTSGLAESVGQELSVFWVTGYGGGLFLPFKDKTSGSETYGGGRYLLDGIKGADLGMRDGKLILDFNFSYLPSCTHSPEWVCPLAPPENALAVQIRAGEHLPSEQ